MNITETMFNKIFFLFLIPLLFLILIIMRQCKLSNILLVIILIILFYHVYSSYKYSSWPFNSILNPDSINNHRCNPYWVEFISVIIAIIIIYIGLININERMICSLIIIIVGLIFGITHTRQIFIKDNNYYKWMYNII